MAKLFKLFGKGLLTTILLPFIILVWILYAVFCFVTFIVLFFINVIGFFQGKNGHGELIEDLEAKKILLEKEKTDEQTKQMVNIMYQNALAQAAANNAMNSEPRPAPQMQPYGINNFAPQPDSINNTINENSENPNTENFPGNNGEQQ